MFEFIQSHLLAVIGGLAFSLVGGVSSTWLYSRLFAARHAEFTEKKRNLIKAKVDGVIPAVDVRLVQPPIPWAGWISDDVIEIPPGTIRGFGNDGYPGSSRAVRAAQPFLINGMRYVTSSFAFDLIGRHHHPAAIVRMTAVIDDQRPVGTGTVYYTVPQGDTTKGTPAFDLGSTDLNARVQDQYGAPTAVRYVAARTVTIDIDEVVGFHANVFAPFFGYDTRYHIEIEFDQGPPIRVYADDGLPFRIVSYPRTAQRGYVTAGDGYDEWAIRPCAWPSQCVANAIGRWPFRE